VTEGPVDGMKCHLLGSNTVTMGKAVLRRQARLIMEHPAEDVYLALDPDAAEETARLVRDLGSEKRVFLLEPARGFKDLGEMSLEGVVEQFYRAQLVTAGHLFIYLAG
jgi:DNA primase